MANRYEDLEELVELARDPSGKPRKILLKRLSDLFLDDPDAYNQAEKSLFGAVMEQVAFSLEQRVREELAIRFADEPSAPPELLRGLANDVIAVARPILEESVALDRHDLVAIAEQLSQDHLLAISKREDVDEELSAVLAHRGDDNVVERLIKNPGAKLSRPTMKHVVSRAKASPQLHEPLASRDDVPMDIIADLFAVVSDDLKRKILSNQSEEGRAELHAALATMRGKARQGGPSQADLYIDRIAENGTLTERKILQLLGQGAVPEFIAGLARLTLVETATVRRAVSDQTGKALAILCKAGGLKRATFRYIVNSPRLFHRRSADEMSEIGAVYDRIDDEAAMGMLRFWRMRKEAADKGEQLPDMVQPSPNPFPPPSARTA